MNSIRRSEKGQVLIIVVLLIIAVIGMLALVLDGGMAYTARRKAQNAADAGALSGADTLCRTENALTAQTVALDFAINRNAATTSIALADPTTATVAVTSTVQVDTFFGKLLGTDVIDAGASARAGCFPVCRASNVMPFAWACKAPTGETTDSTSCVIEFGEVGGSGPLYIVMDSDTVNNDFTCQDPPNSGLPANTLDCDLDNDGVNEVLAGGNRSWLNLDGGSGGASEFNRWITTGESPMVYEQRWYGGTPGVRDTVFSSIELRVGDIVAIPVFDKFCDAWPYESCATTDLNDPVVNSSTDNLYFHVVTFAPFQITCVYGGGNDAACPGHDAMALANPTENWDNVRTIEGIFVEGYIPGMVRCPGANNYYTGAYTVHLLP